MASEAACWTSHRAAAVRAAAAVFSAVVPPVWRLVSEPLPPLDALLPVRPFPRVSARLRAAQASTTATSSTTAITRQRELAGPGRPCRCHHSRMVVASTVPQDGGVLAAVDGWAAVRPGGWVGRSGATWVWSCAGWSWSGALRR